MTDVLGTCLSWGDGICVVQPDAAAGQEPVHIPIADIVSGKPVPPRTPPRLRVEPQDAQVRALALCAALLAWTREAAPLTLASLAGLALLALTAWRVDATAPAVAGAALALISALTFPHAVVVARMDRAQGVFRSS